MTLKERIYKASQNWHIKEDLEKAEQSEEYKRDVMFNDICEYLDSIMDLSNVNLPDYQSVFKFIETKRIDVSQFIKGYGYDDFKQKVIDDSPFSSPFIGKKPDKIYNMDTEENAYEFMEYLDEIRKKRKARRNK